MSIEVGDCDKGHCPLCGQHEDMGGAYCAYCLRNRPEQVKLDAEIRALTGSTIVTRRCTKQRLIEEYRQRTKSEETMEDDERGD